MTIDATPYSRATADRQVSVGRLRPAADTTARVAGERELRVEISHEYEDPQWDEFLARTPGGHHVQSGLWSRVKELLGYACARVCVRRGGQLVGGAQMLMRRSRLGTVGYVPKGPLLADDDPHVAQLVFAELKRLARSHRVRLLVVQPPDHDHELARQLPALGFAPSPVEICSTATCRLDLSKSSEELLAEMKPRTRYNIGLARRKGITVREGTAEDLPLFHRLLEATGRRQKFPVYSAEYYRRLWDLFSPQDAVHMSIAEYQGEPVSAQLVVGFGDTVLDKMRAWSGQWGKYRPNELLEWFTIQWAQLQGFRWYDFDGVEPEAAQAVLSNEPLPERFKQTVTSFKLGFGSSPVLLPGTFDYVYSPPLRLAYRLVISRIARTKRFKDAVFRFRTRGERRHS